MDLEIQRVARELYKAFSGMNEEFKEVNYEQNRIVELVNLQPKDQIVIDELSSHTDSGRQELIHPYKVGCSGQAKHKLIRQFRQYMGGT